MQPLTIEQYRALIQEDRIKIGEEVEEETYPPSRKTSILNEY